MKLTALLATIAMFAICLTGCYNHSEDATEGDTTKLRERFTCVLSDPGKPGFKIWKDSDTGVLYWSIDEGYQMSMSVLLDKDGNPILDEEISDWQ